MDYLVLSLGQLLLEFFHTQAQLLHLTLVLLHTPVCMGQLSHLLLVLLLQLGVDVLQVCQLLRQKKISELGFPSKTMACLEATHTPTCVCKVPSSP